MADMNILGSELAGHGLRNRTKTELGAGEGRVTAATAQARGRAGEKDAALAMGQHQARRLTAGEAAGIARPLPDFAEHAFGRIEDREIDVGTDIENANFERRMLVGGVEEGDDLLLLPRIERAGV